MKDLFLLEVLAILVLMNTLKLNLTLAINLNKEKCYQGRNYSFSKIKTQGQDHINLNKMYI